MSEDDPNLNPEDFDNNDQSDENQSGPNKDDSRNVFDMFVDDLFHAQEGEPPRREWAGITPGEINDWYETYLNSTREAEKLGKLGVSSEAPTFLEILEDYLKKEGKQLSVRFQAQIIDGIPGYGMVVNHPQSDLLRMVFGEFLHSINEKPKSPFRAKYVNPKQPNDKPIEAKIHWASQLGSGKDNTVVISGGLAEKLGLGDDAEIVEIDITAITIDPKELDFTGWSFK